MSEPIRGSWRSWKRALPFTVFIVVCAALAFATAGGSGTGNLFKTQHGKFANGKAIPHPSGGAEVVWDEERQEAADAQSNASSDAPPDATATAVGCANRGTATNVRVNQDCTLRRQAEEQIAVNPIDPSNIIAGQNDSRIGYNHCGFDYSLDGGAHWGDGIPPYYQHTNPGTGHTYDAASDPNVTFSGNGTAWYSCVVFDINSNASGLFANPSTPGLKGSAYANIPDAPSPYVVAETNDGHTFYDKQFMAGDPRPNSQIAYVTFTVFVADQKCSKGNNPGAFCSSEIFFSRWDGTKWSTPANLSGSSSLCVGGDTFDRKADPSACNFNQGSMPVVDSNGNAFVVWNNGNTPTLLNQTLGRRIAANGSLGPVVKVGQDDENNLALCDFGRGPEECVDSINVRTNDFPAISVDPSNPNHLVSVWQDSRQATGQSGDYGVVVSISNDGGQTWSDAAGAGTYLKGAGGEAYFEPSVTITKAGTTAVSFYRANPYAGTDGKGTYGYGLQAGAAGTFGPYTPVSDSQALLSPQWNPSQAGFLGDYSSIAASTAADSNTVYPIWADTRNTSANPADPAHPIPDEDVFVKTIALPLAFGASGPSVAGLSGLNENPPHPESVASGSAVVFWDTATSMMTVNVKFSGLTTANTASHIHCCVAAPGNAGVATVTPTFTGFPAGTSGTYSHTFDMTLASSYNPAFVTAHGGTVAGAEAALLAGLQAGQAYLNIHSSTFPGGEIRGFLRP